MPIRFYRKSSIIIYMVAWLGVFFSGSAMLSQKVIADNNGRERIIAGTVTDENGGVEGAVLRVQTTRLSAISDKDGSFSLRLPGGVSAPIKIAAWAKGYYIGGPFQAKDGQTDVVVSLHKHHDQDNPNYQWLSSITAEGSGENQGCAACHSAAGTGFSESLPVEEWLKDAHSQSAVNPRFISMYLGSDLMGNMGEPTRYVHTKDYGTFPQIPNKKEAYFGPGYKLDFPDKSGNCAACHAPLAAVDAPYDTEPTRLTGVAAEGINCDFCHKVWNVRLDPVTGLPYENRPGVLSFEFRRPPDEHQFFAGPLDDVAPGEDTFSDLQRRSQICAPCHFGVFWDTVVYNSFGEWLQSPYSKPDGGKTCQDCHMPRLGVKYFTLPEKGGLERDPASIFSHYMPGALDEQFLSNAVTMTVCAKRHENHVDVSVTILNDRTGHHVPSGSPLRHMILLVMAKEQDGKELTLVGGPTLPAWCGVGEPSSGYYSGLPGKVFAKILEEEWNRISPTGAYWNPTRVLQDNRVAAFEQDASRFEFAINDSGPIHIEVLLLYRRAYKELMDLKGWELPDIVMERQAITLTGANLKQSRNSGRAF